MNVNTQKHPGDFFAVHGEPLGAIKGYSSDIISDHAIDWLKKRRHSSRPFFMYLSYDAVHIRAYWQYEYPRACDVIGEGYERRLNGQKAKPDKLRPHVALRMGDYVLLGYQTQRFRLPESFKLFNVVKDPGQKSDLSSRAQRRFEDMKSQMKAMYKDVNADRIRTMRANKKAKQ